MKGPAPPPPDPDAIRQDLALMTMKRGGPRSTAWHLTGRWKVRPFLLCLIVWCEEYRFTYEPSGGDATVNIWRRSERWRRARMHDMPRLMPIPPKEKTSA